MDNCDDDVVMKTSTQIEINIGFATQTHWLTVTRVYYDEHQDKAPDIVYAESLFSFWEHPYYKHGGMGPIPHNWRMK